MLSIGKKKEENIMNSTVKAILAIVVVVGLVYWGAMRYSANQFENSELGEELNGAMQACREAQAKGMLSGIPSGDNSSGVTIESEDFEYQDRKSVSFPMQTGCKVTYENQTVTLNLRKEHRNAPWMVIGTAPLGSETMMQDEVEGMKDKAETMLKDEVEDMKEEAGAMLKDGVEDMKDEADGMKDEAGTMLKDEAGTMKDEAGSMMQDKTKSMMK